MKKFGTGLAVLIILALIIYALGGFNKVADVVEDTVDVVADTADAVEDAVEDAMDDADDMDEVIEEEVIEEDDMDDADE
jgi:Na+-transporting methylmalonyl-CoA/oxaloacetate decarboxylase gamma subunit